tara:strand:+ start:295 stop:801 length:507 start_codon:yes stop_codon:yes gene_type:complete
MMKKWIYSAVIVASLLSGCATIVGEPTQLIPIVSSPDGASVVITDEKGVKIFKGATPTSVTLAKSDGSYWGKKEYNVIITKNGFSPYELPIKSSANGWYIGGNLIFGGLIGYFIVDPMNGNMYTLSVKDINATLPPQSGENSNGDHSINIVMLDNIPDTLRPKMVQIN